MKKIIIIIAALITSITINSQIIVEYNSVIYEGKKTSNKLKTIIIINDELTDLDLYFPEQDMKGHYSIIEISKESYDGIIVYKTYNIVTRDIVCVTLDTRRNVIKFGTLLFLNK